MGCMPEVHCILVVTDTTLLLESLLLPTAGFKLQDCAGFFTPFGFVSFLMGIP